MDTQVDDSSYWKRADPAGKMRESHRILQENTGKNRKMEAVFRPEIVGFFPVTFRPFPAKNSPENGHTSPKDG